MAINTITNINEWLTANKLLISLPKTCYTIFSAQNKSIPEYFNSRKIAQIVIKRTATTKYIRIILDGKLDWHEHIQQLTQDLAKICKLIQDYKNLYTHQR